MRKEGALYRSIQIHTVPYIKTGLPHISMTRGAAYTCRLPTVPSESDDNESEELPSIES